MKKFFFTDKLTDAQIQQLHSLSQQMWWSRERTIEEVVILIKNSMSFALIENDTQKLAGYARVLTDEIRYACILDVMVVEQHRGEGLGKLIVDTIIKHPRLKKVKKFDLTCAEDLIPFYKKFGFSENYGEVKPMRFERFCT